MDAVLEIVLIALTVFWLFLIFRLVMEYVFLFARSFRPSGVLAAVLELAYSVTDPPLKFLRRFIPPLRLGSVALDLSMLVLFLLVFALRNVVQGAIAA